MSEHSVTCITQSESGVQTVRHTPVSLLKVQWQVTPKHAYTFDPTKLEWADYAAAQA